MLGLWLDVLVWPRRYLGFVKPSFQIMVVEVDDHCIKHRIDSVFGWLDMTDISVSTEVGQ